MLFDPRVYGAHVGKLLVASFVLSAAAQVPREALRTTLPTQIKIGPPDKIRDLVMTAVPGIRIEPIDAPRQIPFNANDAKMEFETVGEVVEAIKKITGRS